MILRKSHNKKKLLELKDQELHQTQVEKVIKAVRKLKKPLNRQFQKKKKQVSSSSDSDSSESSDKSSMKPKKNN